MKKCIKPVIGTLAAALLLASSLAARAALPPEGKTATQNITMTGTIAPPPPVCTFGNAPVFNFTGTADKGIVVSAPFTLSITCTSGLNWSLSSPSAWLPVTVGGKAAGVGVHVVFGGTPSFNLADMALMGSGTGSVQNAILAGRLGGATPESNLDPGQNVGAVSGTAQLIMSY